MEEFTTPASPELIESEEDIQKRVFPIKRLIQQGLGSMMRRDNVSDEQAKAYVFPRARIDMANLLDDTTQFNEMIVKFEQTEFSNKEDFLEHFTNSLALLLARKFSSLEELEQKMHQVPMETQEYIAINELIQYELVSPDTIELHISPQLTKTPIEIRGLMRHGLELLAGKLTDDQSLANINKIRGNTWIAFQHPKLAEGFGFTVTQRDESGQVATVEMDRSKLVSLYKK